MADSDVAQDHPLAAELSSLRSALIRFQDEAHHSSVRLQRHSLDFSHSQDQLGQLERENALLMSELAILRANPHPGDASRESTTVSLHVLAQRRLSDQLTLTEEALQSHIAELAHAKSAAVSAKYAMEGAYELAARTRSREEDGKRRERALKWKAKAAEEEKKMTDLVVSEYADLVRSLEVRTPSQSSLSLANGNGGLSPKLSTASSSTTLIDGLSEGKVGLQKLLSESSAESERLHFELDRLYAKLAFSEARCEVERKSAENDRIELAKCQFQLQKLLIDDNAAAKMVSRYMKFSQKSTDSLQLSLTALNTRHEASLNTLSVQLSILADQLQSSQSTTERLRCALDDLGADILKESYGRRREVALRIRMASREERLHEALGRWVRRTEESLARNMEALRSEPGLSIVEQMVHEARDIISNLGEPSADSSSSQPSSGSVGRILVAENAVKTLVGELQAETSRRMELERVVAAGPPLELGRDHAITPDPKSILGDVGIPLPQGLAFGESAEEPLTHGERLPNEKLFIAGDNPSSLMPTEAVGSATTIAENLYPPVGFSPEPSSLPDISSIADQSISTNLNEETTQKTVSEMDIDISPKVHIAATAVDDVLQELSTSITGVLSIGSVDLSENSASEALSATELLLSVHSNHTSVSSDEQGLHPHEKYPPITTDSVCEISRIPDLSDAPQTQETLLRTDTIPLVVVNVASEKRSSDGDASLVTITHSLPSRETSVEGYPEISRLTPVQSAYSSHEQEIGLSEQHPPGTVQPANQKISIIADPLEAPLKTPETPQSAELPSPISSIRSSHVELPEQHPPIDNQLVTQIPDIPDPPRPPPHRLLAGLTQVGRRYADLQRAFRDCHLALETLKSDIISYNNETPSRNVLQTAMERLNDYAEDARVELEIRIADETLLAHGFETLLSVPGAVMPSSSSTMTDDHESTPPSQTEVELQIEAFISGTDFSVHKAQQGFIQKLDDIQHDIAALKRAVHDPALSPLSPTTPPLSATGSASANGNDGSWTSWIRSASAGPGPGSGPAPTFGNVMTTPRLRHSPSLNFHGGQPRKPGYGALARDPFASLGLKVPMPSYVPQMREALAPRARTVSTMYMLGLGARSASGALVSPRSPIGFVSGAGAGGVGKEMGGDDADVE